MVVAALDQLPEFITAPLRGRLSLSDGEATKAADAARPSDFGQPFRLALDGSAALNAVRTQLRNHGFFYGSDKGPSTLTLARNGVLIGAVSPIPPLATPTATTRRSTG